MDDKLQASSSKSHTNTSSNRKKPSKKVNRRRRGKKDVILDFRKKAKQPTDDGQKVADKVVQRKFETTGQYFRRLDRLVAKAKVEASLEARFDMTLPKSE